jgi:lipid-A-disaccharide synthase
VIFPFEERYFSSFGIETEFVGNPNAENMQPVTNATESGTLGILPGSRKQEILRILPPCIDAARILVDKSVFSRVIVSKSDGIDETILKDMLPADNRFEIINGSRPIFEKSSFLFVKSGTATLEAALAGKPFLSVYKVSAITAMIVRRILKIPNVTMINIMLDSPVVPEILQEKLTSENLVAETLSLVNDNNRLSSMESKFKALAETIANQKPSEKVADIIRKMCNG